MTIRAVIVLIVALAACRGGEKRENATSVPLGRGPSREEMERARFDESWRKLESFGRTDPAAGTAAMPSQTPIPILTDSSFAESLQDLGAVTLDSTPVRVPIRGDVSGPSVLRAQILLDRAGFSVGSIDGRWGKNSEIAAYWFQQTNGIPPTGEIDEGTFRLLLREAAPTITEYTLTADDLQGPFRSIPEGVYKQAQLDCLCFSTAAEKIAEKFHSSPGLLERLNPGVSLAALRAGQRLRVPAIAADQEVKNLTRIVVSVEGNYLHGLDGGGTIRFHAPTTVGSKYDPSPNETLRLTSITFNPWFRYQPRLFSEVPDDEPEASLSPGPNSPVGVVWMALSKPHYGIHGTSEPETIGYASSHGCVRLTNWDAHELAHRINEGASVAFVDPRGHAADGD